MNSPMLIKPLSRQDILTHIDALNDILVNCVNGGASVSFMLPFSAGKAQTFWLGVADSVGRDERIVLGCFDAEQGLVGTVQLIIENQPHRADVAKLLVHEKARRKGAAMALMEALEAVAREKALTVLVLDTSTGSGAETFYQRAGWQKAGEIPRYALMPNGDMTATSVFYKFL